MRQLKDFLLIDVREPEEHEALAIPGAVLMPKNNFEDGSALKTLPRDRQIILYCRSGIRSGQCLTILKSAGFTNVTHLNGGILAWEESNR